MLLVPALLDRWSIKLEREGIEHHRHRRKRHRKSGNFGAQCCLRKIKENLPQSAAEHLGDRKYPQCRHAKRCLGKK